MKKATTLLCLLVLGITQIMSQTPIAPALGDGTNTNPYQIATLENLAWLQTASNSGYWNKEFIQTADIDASATATWNGGAGFSPIGNLTTPFSGSYNGQKHTITNLKIVRSNESEIGLFGFADSNSRLLNIGLVSIDFTGASYVGGIAGRSFGYVTNSFTTGTINASNGDCVGGLIGFKNYGTLSYSYSEVAVRGSFGVGGLVGFMRSSNYITNSYSTGSVNGKDMVGGLVGYIAEGEILNSYSISSVTGITNVGGMVGLNELSEATSTNCFWDTQTSALTTSALGTGKTTAELKNSTTYNAWDFGFIWAIDPKGAINNGYPYLRWRYPSNDGNWVSVGTTYCSVGGAYKPQIAINSMGTVYVAYMDQTIESRATVRRLNSTGTAWEPVGNAGVSSTVAWDLKLLMVQDTPYICFRNSDAIKVMKYNNSSWEDVGNPYVGNEPFSSTFAYDKTNKLYVAYTTYNYVANQFVPVNVVKKLNGKNWETVGTNFTTRAAEQLNISFDNSNNLYISYLDVNSSVTDFAKFNGTSWETYGAIIYGAGTFMFNNNTPYLLFTNDDYEISLGKLNSQGTAWVPVGAKSFTPKNSDYANLAFYNNVPYVSFINGLTGDPAVMKFNGTNWEFVGNDIPLLRYSSYTAMAFDRDGVPNVVFNTQITDMAQAESQVVKFVAANTPVSPAATAATNISSNEFVANWSAVLGATGYQLEVSTDNFTSQIAGSPFTLETSSLSKKITGLSNGTAYKYRLKTIYPLETSGYSNEISVTTLQIKPEAPNATAATAATTSGFTANWEAVSGAANYLLEVSADNFITQCSGSPFTIASPLVAKSVTGLVAGFNYKYRIKATNTAGSSQYSNTISVSTPAAEPTGIVMATGCGIVKCNLDGSNQATIIPDIVEITISYVAYSASNNRLYWTNMDDGSLNSAVLNGNTLSDYKSWTNLYCGDLEVDNSNNTIYWIDYAYNKIQRCNLDGTGVVKVADLVGPTDGLNITATRIYFADYTNKTIGSVKKDGTGLVKYNVGVECMDLFVDEPAGIIYYRQGDFIGTINTDGTNNNPTAISLGIVNPSRGLIKNNNDLYFCDYKTIKKVKTNGTGLSIVSTFAPKFALYGLSFVSPQTPTLPNAPVASAATALSTSGFTANWVASSQATSYLLEVSEDNFTSQIAGSPFTITAPTVAKAITGLSAGTTYKYRLRTVSSLGAGDYGNVIEVKTVSLPPTITSFSPTSGTIGTTVTITGTNFSDVPANNIVCFGAVKATVTAATSKSLTITVPAGAGSVVPISVLCNGFIAYSNTCEIPTFNFTFTPNVTPSYSLSSIKIVDAEIFPKEAASADFNGDGIPDLVVGLYRQRALRISLGDGKGGFTFKSDIPLGLQNIMTAIEAGDLNNDGKIDLAVAAGTKNTICILLGDGMGGFTIVNNFAATSPNDLAFGDFNSDGYADIVAVNMEGHSVSLFTGDGKGAFGNLKSFPANVYSMSIEVNDFNGDKKADIAVAGQQATVSILLGTGTGSFGTKTDYRTGGQSLELKLADFNGDGKLDLATLNQISNDISVLLGDGLGGFGSKTDIKNPQIAAPRNLEIADYNGDGIIDIAIADLAFKNVYVLIGTGTGSFKSALGNALSAESESIIAGDYNRDGKTDIVAVSAQSYDVSVLLYQATSPSVASQAVTSIGSVSAVGNGNILDLGVANPTQYGVIWSTTANPDTLLPTKTTQGAKTTTGAFTSNIIGLEPNTKYYVKAYATNSSGTGYGDEVTFTTLALPPTITSFSPTSGTIGTTVTITGENFSTTPSENVVFFGTTKAIVTASTKTSITTTVPVGVSSPSTISLFINGLTVYSSASSTPNFNITQSPVLHLNYELTTLTAGNIPRAIAVGDLNNDNIADLAVANLSSNDVSILLGKATGGFATAVNFAVGTSPNVIAIADLNKDSNKDLVVGNYLSNNISILLGNGNGSFLPANHINYYRTATSFSIFDFNGDGNLDIATSNTGGHGSLLLGNGLGGFNFPTIIEEGDVSGSVNVGDFNKDGKADLIFTNIGDNQVSVMFGNGAGIFNNKTSFAVGKMPYSVAIGDFNNDGNMDAVSANFDSTNVSVLLGTGTGSFANAVDIEVGKKPCMTAVSDLDGDGNADIITANYDSKNISILLGNGDGSFKTATNFTIGNNPSGLIVGDFNNDGKTDIATSDEAGGVSVLQYQKPIPTISDISPLAGSVGTPITITGKCFSANASDIEVYFGTAKATITASTETSITVAIPGEAKSGKIKVIMYNDESVESSSAIEVLGPMKTALFPATTASNVGLQPTLTITFDQDVVLGDAGQLTINNGATVVRTIDLSIPADKASVNISTDKKSVSVTIPEPLLVTTAYTVGISNGFVKDNYNNNFVGFTAESNSWKFTTLNKLPQAFSFPSIATKTYGDAPFTLGDATTNKNLAITYTAKDTNVVKIIGTQATILKAGSTIITALQAGNNVFSPITIEKTLNVNKVPLTVTAINQSKVFDGAVFTNFTVSYDGIISGESNKDFEGKLTFGGTASTTKNVGENYEIIPSGLSSTNYDIAYVNGKLAITKRPITLTADTISKIFGNNDPAFSATITAGNVIEGDTATGFLQRAIGEIVGKYAINKGTYTFGNNYNETFVVDSLTITKRPITISADAATKVYGDNDPIFTAQVSAGNVMSGDVFTGTMQRDTGKNVGKYTINKGSYTYGNNYQETFIVNNLEITKQHITIAADTISKIYGNIDPIIKARVTSGKIVFGDLPTGKMQRAEGTTVGKYAISKGNYTYGDNYNETFVTNDFEIVKRPITIVAAARSKIYGDTESIFSAEVTVGDVVKGDVATGNLQRVAGENVGKYSINQGDYSFGQNYDETFIPNLLTIKKRPITLTADAKSKFVGDSDSTFTANVTKGSLAFNDVATGSMQRIEGEAVGKYTINKGTYSYGANYAETFESNDFEIRKRIITLSIDAKTKTFGDVDPAFTVQVTSGTIATGDIATGTLQRIEGENVGKYTIDKGTYTYGDNYIETFITNELEITKRPITITAQANSKTYGTIDPEFTPLLTSGTIVNGNMAKGKLKRIAGENIGKYPIIIGSYTYGDNYNETFVSDSLSITKRNITITVDAKIKVYGNNDPAFSTKITTGTLVEGDFASGLLQRIPGENIGKYDINKGTFTFGNNYNETFINNQLEIVKRPITISADAKTKIYGDNDPSFTSQVSTGNIAFNDVSTGLLQRVAGENIGNYSINKGSFTYGNNYTETFIANELLISKRNVTVSAVVDGKVYDGTTISNIAPIVSPLAPGDNVLVAPKQQFDNANVGVNHTLIASGLAIKNSSNIDVTNNYAVNYIASAPSGEIRPKQLGVVEPMVTFSKIYDGTTSANIIAGAMLGVEPIDFENLSLSATANYNDLLVGYNKTITVEYTLNGVAKTNYLAPISQIFNNVSAEITRKQLTMSDPNVAISKIVDGNNHAFVNEIGSLIGVASVDAGTLAVAYVATYNDAIIGKSKTITIEYSISGTSLDNYIKPENFVINNARILDFITLNPIANPTAGCEGSSISFDYSIATGSPLHYQIIFDNEANAAGIQNVNYTYLPTFANSGTISFPIPSGCKDGTYRATFTTMGEVDEVSPDYTFEFTVNLSKDLLYTKFNKIVLLDNSSNRFAGYQWYKNGVEIKGAQNQFYNDPKGLVGAYSVRATTTEGQKLMSCEKSFNFPMIQSVGVYPSPSKVNQPITIAFDGFEDQTFDNSELVICNLQGVAVYKMRNVQKTNVIQLSVMPGIYVGYFTSANNEKQMFKISVEN